MHDDELVFLLRNGQIVYQANPYMIWPSHILRSLLCGRRQLETYSSLFTISNELGVGVDYLALFVVDEFLDVFPEELLGLPLDWEIEFCIDLFPAAQPVSIPPYKMARAKLTESRKKLDELLAKGFIQSYTSPWGAPVLFVKKADESLRLCLNYRKLN